MTDSNEELLPCQFCGNPPSIFHETNHDDEWIEHNTEDCPVSPDTIVKVTSDSTGLYRTNANVVGPDVASRFEWRKSEGTIIKAYRIIDKKA